MKISFDTYTIQARLLPAIVAGAPALAFAALLVSWGEFGLTQVIAGLALSVLFSVFADVARRRGRAIEPALISKMGGLPTTVWLRHRDQTYDTRTKAQLHAFLADKLGEAAPTPNAELADPASADAYYVRGVAWLRENTRDTKKFNLLFNENITYGFRRNLLGLKLSGFVLNVVIVAICFLIFWARWPLDFSSGLDGKLLAVIVLAILHATYLAFFVTEAGVFEAARLYARQLFLCTQSP